MKSIQDSRLTSENNRWFATCKCGKDSVYSSKSKALSMLERGACRNCSRNYVAVSKNEKLIYKRQDSKWCSTCSGCGIEQAYTRKDHAKQSSLQDWQCKKCVCKAKSFHANKSVGNARRLFNKFKIHAEGREIPFCITIDEMVSKFTGKCALSGWDISMTYTNTTASLDRIDSDKGYTIDNIQWVHKMVNMTKNKYDQAEFVRMCKAIAENNR